MDIQGLLGNPQFNLGVGLLSQAGPSLQPISFGQALGGAMNFATQREAQGLRLEAQRQALEANKRRQNAMTELGGILQNPAQNVPAAIRNPNAAANEQQQIMGLLGQIAPEQMAQGLLGQVFAKPDTPTTSRLFNDTRAMFPQMQPGTPEFVQAMQQVQQMQNPVDQQEQARNALLIAQLQSQVADNQATAQERRQQEHQIQSGISSGVQDMLKAWDVNARLEDTMLQSGLPGNDIRRGLSGAMEAALSAFGRDDSRYRQMNSDFDIFKKISRDFATNSMQQLGGSGGAFRLQTLIDANANQAASPDANAYVIASNLQELLTQARANGVQLDPQFQRKAEQIVQQVFTPPPSGFVED